MTQRKINIAIDGYSSCGKSTVAKAIAKHMKYIYVDTGAMYRAVALYCILTGILQNKTVDHNMLLEHLPQLDVSFQYNSETETSETYLNGENVEKQIREMEVSNQVSTISAIKKVRKKLVAIQQQIGKQKGVVMDGRDIGSVVFPDAELKLFMTADNNVRVKRRYDELLAKGTTVSLQEVEENIRSRDFADTHRVDDPLVQAADAIVIDNTNLSMKEQLEMVLNLVKNKLSGSSSN